MEYLNFGLFVSVQGETLFWSGARKLRKRYPELAD